MTEASTSVVEATFFAYMRAVLEGDRRKAYGVIDRAHEVGVDLPALYLNVFQAALREIGRLWQENKITVADEHLATAITQGAMARLFEQVFVWRPSVSRSVMAACVDPERHEVGLRMLCDLLELGGWDTTYLGASVPVESLVEMVARKSPDVVALSTALPPHLPRLKQMIQTLRAAQLTHAPLIIVGGRPFLEDPTLALKLGADLTASDASEAVTLLDRWVGRR